MTSPDRLRRLQAEFAGALLRGDGAQFARHLAGDGESAQHRLAVYRHAILANRRGALRAAYPVVERLVGEGFFAEAALRHGEESPPGCADLNRYGASFPAFLAAYPHAAPMPWLADVARLEWAWHESLMAAETPGLDFAQLALVPEERQPALRLPFIPRFASCARPGPCSRSGKPTKAIATGRRSAGKAPTRSSSGGRTSACGLRSSRRLKPHSSRASRAACDSRKRPASGAGWDFARALRRLADHGMLCGFSD